MKVSGRDWLEVIGAIVLIWVLLFGNTALLDDARIDTYLEGRK